MWALDRLAVRHRRAALRFARMAKDVEASIAFSPALDSNNDRTFEGLQDELMQLSSAAVIMAVAGWEANINERLHDAYDSLPLHGRRIFSKDKNPEVLRAWGELWVSELNKGAKLDCLQKTQMALEKAGLQKLPAGRGSVQEFQVLLNLRNALVHVKPAWRQHFSVSTQKDRDSLESNLRVRFLPSKLARGGDPYFWKHCLGSGCAVWAVKTADALCNDVNERLGLSETVDSGL